MCNFVRMYVRMYVCVSICMSVCMCVVVASMDARMRACMFARRHVSVRLSVFLSIYLSPCQSLSIHSQMSIHTCVFIVVAVDRHLFPAYSPCLCSHVVKALLNSYVGT